MKIFLALLVICACIGGFVYLQNRPTAGPNPLLLQQLQSANMATTSSMSTQTATSSAGASAAESQGDAQYVGDPSDALIVPDQFKNFITVSVVSAPPEGGTVVVTPGKSTWMLDGFGDACHRSRYTKLIAVNQTVVATVYNCGISGEATGTPPTSDEVMNILDTLH